MKRLTFYEKPGCKGNALQKAFLERAGFALEVKSLLVEPWTQATLRPFFGARPVADWFNRTAPAIKTGRVLPDEISEDAALAAMVADPLLIRRPLIVFHGIKMCGFDKFVLCDVLGLPPAGAPLEACQSVGPNTRCD
jgi:nitrogenase-associated protein